VNISRSKHCALDVSKNKRQTVRILKNKVNACDWREKQKVDHQIQFSRRLAGSWRSIIWTDTETRDGRPAMLHAKRKL